jgi:hypothetical protein
MALNNQKNFIVAGIVILLATVGAAAWIHESNRPLAAPAAVTDTSAQLAPNGQPYNTNYAPAPAALVSTGDGYYPLTERPAYIRQPEAAYAPANGPDADDQYAQPRGPEYRHRERHHGRSKKHSVEIVAGTAAAGAVIGGIAGGGPGAAIGAASGAGAGFTYDRLTHNH